MGLTPRPHVDTSRILPGGHRWFVCSSCRLPAIALEPGGRCRQRAAVGKVRKLPNGTDVVRWSCPGVMVAPDATATAAAIGRGDVVGCVREGCGNVARVTTWRGEKVCLRCLGELADGYG